MSKKMSLSEILGKFESQKNTIGVVTLCEGKEWELEVEVPAPMGAKWLQVYPKLAKLVMGVSSGMLDVSQLEDDSMEGAGQVLDFMDNLFGQKDLMTTYVPLVFGLDHDEGDRYISTFLEPRDCFGPFIEAASMIIAHGMGNNQDDLDELEVAQKNSKDAPG